jgi:hypothetical protein
MKGNATSKESFLEKMIEDNSDKRNAWKKIIQKLDDATTKSRDEQRP